MIRVNPWLLWCCYLLLINAREGWGKKGECAVCKDFVKAFEEGLKSTEKSSYAGGDTSWEEENLGAYADSEVRLVEILDQVCRDYECHRLLEHNEEHIERWWFKLRHKKNSLQVWFCNEYLDVCCPENTYGPTCEACPGGVANPCGGQGTCEGAEEKDGEGSCRCNYGYSGDTCQECDSGFYNDSFSCVACHRSCSGGCSGGGAGDCVECAGGYVRKEDSNECEDIDECSEEAKCKEGKYCLNIPGSYRCHDCDRSCKKTCTGAGPTKCVECGPGYYQTQHNLCRDIDECAGGDGEGGEGEGVKCEGDTYCENTPGSYQCRACHVACLGGCTGAGPASCRHCKEGFNMKDEECRDIDECNGEAVSSSPCNVETEVCNNLVGSFACKCKPGLVRVDGVCTAEVVKRDNGNKKKTKRKKRARKPGNKEEEEDGEKKRIVFPWYHTLGPLLVAIATYKYSRPDLVSSAVMTLALAAVVFV